MAKNGKILMGCMVATAMMMTSQALAQDVDGTKFRAPEEGVWYHPIEPESWAARGGDQTKMEEVLLRIQNAKGARFDKDQPDTIVEYGPGNWVYEFVKLGDETVKSAELLSSTEDKIKALAEAVVYYHVASAPHAGEPNEAAALKKAQVTYADAAKLLPGEFTRVEIEHEGRTFVANYHKPNGDGPYPVLVLSNGSDMSKENVFRYYEKLLQPNGIAFLTLDVPGMGDSSAFNAADGKTDKLHAAAIEWAKLQPELDADNVFIQGASFGGNAIARAFLTRPELDLAGAIFLCGPINQVFQAPAEAYAHFPKFNVDGMKTRLGLDNGADFEELETAIRVLSLENQGVLDGDLISTPLLVVNTNEDPVSPLEDTNRLIARATNVTKIIYEIPGHCPPAADRQEIATDWMLENLRS